MATKAPLRSRARAVTPSPRAPCARATEARGDVAPDRRVRRTERALREALYAAIREQGWEAVRVQDVCERANVGRSTFYAHFADKEDLLVSGFDELSAEMRAHALARRDAPLSFARPLLEHVRDHWWIFRILDAQRSQRLVLECMLDVVTERVLEDAALPPAHPRREVEARYVAGAFIELVRWWMEPRNQGTSVDEVAGVFERMTSAALREAPTAAPRRSP